MALAQELMDPSGGTSGAYHLAMARVQLQKEQFKDAEESIQEALQHSYQVGRLVIALCAEYDGKFNAYQYILYIQKMLYSTSDRKGVNSQNAPKNDKGQNVFLPLQFIHYLRPTGYDKSMQNNVLGFFSLD